MNKLLNLRTTKRIAAVLLSTYAFVVISFYIYFAITIDPFGAALITDNYLVSGPVKRALNPAVSDEELIELLTKDKSKFEELVEIHAAHCLSDRLGRPSPEARKIISEIGLLKAFGVKGQLWLPAPYSSSSIELWRARIFNLNLEMDEASKAAPRDQGSEAVNRAVEKYRIEECKYQSVRFVREKITATGGLVKGVEYFPQSPLIKNRRMILPSLHESTRGDSTREIVNDLAELPRGFWMNQKECAYRSVDEKWFLFVCPD